MLFNARHSLQLHGAALLLALVGLLAGGPAVAERAPATADSRPLEPTLLSHLARSLSQETKAADPYDAEVWLHWANPRLARRMPRPAERVALLNAVYAEALRHGIDPGLILAVIQVESAFDRFAVSRVGAQGVMQIMPFWKRELGRADDNLMLVTTNVRYGVAILAHYLQAADGDLVDALARYNGSTGRLRYPELVVNAWRKRWQSEPDGKAALIAPDLNKACTRYALSACRGRR